MILIHLVVDGEDLRDSNLMNSSKKIEMDNHVKMYLMAKWIKYSHFNLEVDGLIPHL